MSDISRSVVFYRDVVGLTLMFEYIYSDWAWLAVDAVGGVAVFTTAGVAPIPVAVLRNAEWVEPVEELIGQMPAGAGYELLVRYSRPDDYIGFASRGFFAYDWQDVHRTIGKTRAYELIAKPAVPVHVDDLPPAIARAARLAVLASVRFKSATSLAVERLLSCQSA